MPDIPRFTVLYWTTNSSESNAQNVHDENALRTLTQSLREDNDVTEVAVYSLHHAEKRTVQFRPLPSRSTR